MDFIPYHNLVGSICKISALGVELAKEYEIMFGLGNANKMLSLYQYCHMGSMYEMSLMLIDQPPFTKGGTTWYCFKEVGIGVMGDWHWLTLNQVIFCKET